MSEASVEGTQASNTGIGAHTPKCILFFVNDLPGNTKYFSAENRFFLSRERLFNDLETCVLPICPSFVLLGKGYSIFYNKGACGTF